MQSTYMHIKYVCKYLCKRRHVGVYVFVGVRVRVHVRVYVCVCMCACMYACACVRLYLRVHVRVYISVCACACMHVYVRVYAVPLYIHARESIQARPHKEGKRARAAAAKIHETEEVHTRSSTIPPAKQLSAHGQGTSGVIIPLDLQSLYCSKDTYKGF